MYTKGFVHGRPGAVTCVGNILGQVVVSVISEFYCSGSDSHGL
jgi:hypothetical protein